MKLSELIATYGDEHVTYQPLDSAIDTINMTKAGTKITFGTDEPFDHNGTVRMALVVWMDRKRVAEIIAASKVGA
ncbi:hypothetical protein GOZ83_19565 [Agrobacterium vitis]|uniref:hypothetical protein n=1 Tax=Agrobacterium vitis TaxID=373 RepID=UPI0012E73AAC|nr:hypothetical protein [Agrobacterium vitis]MVA47256.1 hypothetical protein [Agrobacterium vitis]